MITGKRAPGFLALSLSLAVVAAACASSSNDPGAGGTSGKGGSGGSGSGGSAGSKAGGGGSSIDETGGAGGSAVGGGSSGGGSVDADNGGSSGDADTTPVPDAAGADDVASAPDAAAGSEAGAPVSGGVTTGGDPKPCTFALCDSFEGAEGAAPDSAVWSRQGSPTVSTKYAARGKSSLHIPPLTAGTQFIRETKTFPALGKTFYTRVFLYVERQPTEKPDRLYHWTLVEASDQAGGGNKVLRLGGHIEGSGTDWLRFNYNTHGAAGETGLSDMAAVLEPKKWYCLEGYWDMVAEEAQFWIDGVDRPMLHWKKTDAKFPFPTDVKSLAFGWAEYQASKTPFEVYIDELAVDGKRIGCDQ